MTHPITDEDIRNTTPDWEGLVLSAGRLAGKVGISHDRRLRFSFALAGSSVHAPQRMFLRLVREGKIDPNGVPLERAKEPS